MQGLDCLTNIVGLADTTCDCWDADKPTDFAEVNESKSGLFIDELIPVNFSNSAADCERGGVWDILQKARKQAVNDFLTDYSNMVLKTKSHKFEPFKGLIGAERFNTSLNFMSASNWVGVKVCPAYIKGGKLILTGIKLALDNLSLPSQSIDVFVYSNLDFNTPLASLSIELTANNKFFSQSFSSPVVLDLGNKDEDLEYYVVYEKTAGLRYVNNKVLEGCGCGGSRYSTNPYLRFVDVDGIEATTLENLYTQSITSDGNARGLRLEGYTSCDYFEWLCELSYSAQDLASNIGGGFDVNLGMQLAAAIRTKAAFWVADKILTSSNINRITLLNREILNEKMAKWYEQYKDYLKMFVYAMPDYVNDCFTCKVDKNISVNQILA